MTAVAPVPPPVPHARLRAALARLEPQDTDPGVWDDLAAENAALAPARARANAELLGDPHPANDQGDTVSDRAQVLTEASATARGIAKRCRDKAGTKTGDDRKHWHAMAAGASMVALKLTEQADAAEAGRD